MNKKILLLILFGFCNQILVFGQLNVTSNLFVSKNISSGSVIEAGMDFQDEIIFSSDEIILSVAILPQNLDNVMYNAWQIQVSKNDLDWHNDLVLWIRRTGDGKSDYNMRPQNGTYYQEVELFNALFFEGQGWISLIPIQLKLTGLSVTLPAKSYSTEIIFTLIDN